MHDHRKGKDRDSGRRARDEHGREGVGTRPTPADWLDDGLEVMDAAEDPEAIRARLRTQVLDDAEAMAQALNKFQDLLRRRDAGPTIEKAIGGGKLKETVKEKIMDMVKEHARAGAEKIAESAEAGPLGAAIRITKEVKTHVDDHVKAQQARAKVDSITEIVGVASGGLWQQVRAETARIDRALPMDLARMGRGKREPVDQVAIIARLDAMLLQALRESGTQTVNEQLDALKQRAKLRGEIEEVEEAWPSDEK
jgi:hypothetical protein